jgi:tetratricopeptide (TPR) repeat protein
MTRLALRGRFDGARRNAGYRLLAAVAVALQAAVAVTCAWAGGSAGSGAAAAPAASAAGAPAPAADRPFRAPYVPARDDEILQQVPPASDPAVRQMASLRSRLAADAANLRVATDLARAYVDFGRRVGDAHYAGYAEAVIAPWMAAAEPPPPIIVLQATILQFRHEFAPARRLLKQALGRDPKNAQAWLTLATLDMVQGEYAAASADCAQTARTAGFVIGTACSANLRSYLGQARESVALLSGISGESPGSRPAFAAWIEGLLAEANERLGNWPSAEAHYRKALTYTPDDNFLLVAYADFLLDRGRPAEVLTLLADYAQSDTAYLRLALAHAALETPQAAQYAWIMGARFDALAQRGSDFYGREQVRFALHLQRDPRTALALAQRNWEAQRAPWDARVLLEAARAADDPQAATGVLAFVRETKLEDPVIESLARELEGRVRTAAIVR